MSRWDFRYIATGKGLTADAIYTGYLSAERIEAGSITTDKLSSSVGQELDIGSNVALNLYATVDGTRPAGTLHTTDALIDIRAGNGTTPASITVASGGKIDIQAGAENTMDGTLNIGSTGTLNLNANSNMYINSNGKLTVSGGTIDIQSGGVFLINSENFKIQKNSTTGKYDVTIKGNITTTGGNIAGFTIGSASGRTYMYAGQTQSVTDDNKNGIYLGTDGINIGGKFMFSHDGSTAKLKINASDLQIGNSSYEADRNAEIVETVKVYKTGTSNSTAPSVTSGLDASWTQNIVSVNSTNKYLWSRLRYKTYAGNYSYGTAVYEADLSSEISSTRPQYMRTNSTTAPSATSGNWLDYVPAPTKTAAGVETNPYVWVCTYIIFTNGTTSRINIHRDNGLESMSGAAITATNIASGLTSVPYVKSTGVTIKDNDLTVSATGNLTVAANASVNITNSSGNSGVILNKDGISIASGANIAIVAGGGINLGTAGKNFTIGANNNKAYIYNGTDSMSSTTAGIYLGTDGINVGGGVFKVSADGKTTYFKTSASNIYLGNVSLSSTLGTMDTNTTNAQNAANAAQTSANAAQTSANNAQASANAAQTAANNAQSSADEKAKSYRTTKATLLTKTDFKVGDIWQDSASSYGYEYICKKKYDSSYSSSTFNNYWTLVGTSAVGGAALAVDAEAGTINMAAANTITIASGATISIAASKKLSLTTKGTIEIGNGGSPFTIGSNGTNAYIYNGMTSLTDTTHNGIYVGTNGIALGKGAFKVDSSGNLSATSATISGNSTFSGTMSANCITSGTLSANYINGGSIDASNVTITNLNASNITSGTMSANKISGGSINASNVTITNLNASNITSGTMSASKISGGTLTLGGASNGSGTLVINNASGTKIGGWDNSGISASAGSIGGWTINSANIASGTGTSNVTLNSDTTTASVKDYAIWAGNSSPTGTNPAPFRVKRDGTVYLTKLMTIKQNSDGTFSENEIDLTNKSSGLWKLGVGATVRSVTVENDSCTTMTFSNAVSGYTSVNFTSAASVDFDKNHIGIWNAGKKKIYLTNGKEGEVEIPSPEAEDWSGTYYGIMQGVPTQLTTVIIGGKAFTGQNDASGAYNAGKNIMVLGLSATDHTVSVVAQSGSSGSKSLPVTAAADPWDGTTATIRANIGGVTIATNTVSADGFYRNGWNDCRDGCIGYASADSKTLSYGESVTVFASKPINGGGNTSIINRTYVAPADNYNTGWNDARSDQTTIGTCYQITAHNGDWVKVTSLGTGYSRVPYKS